MSQTIDQNVAYEMMAKSDGKIFTVKFITRGKGELRTMNCRLGVTIGVKGVGMSYDAAEKGLLGVYDMQAPGDDKRGGFRMVALEGVSELTIEGNKFEVVGA